MKSHKTAFNATLLKKFNSSNTTTLPSKNEELKEALSFEQNEILIVTPHSQENAEVLPDPIALTVNVSMPSPGYLKPRATHWQTAHIKESTPNKSLLQHHLFRNEENHENNPAIEIKSTINPSPQIIESIQHLKIKLNFLKNLTEYLTNREKLEIALQQRQIMDNCHLANFASLFDDQGEIKPHIQQPLLMNNIERTSIESLKNDWHILSSSSTWQPNTKERFLLEAVLFQSEADISLREQLAIVNAMNELDPDQDSAALDELANKQAKNNQQIHACAKKVNRKFQDCLSKDGLFISHHGFAYELQKSFQATLDEVTMHYQNKLKELKLSYTLHYLINSTERIKNNYLFDSKKIKELLLAQPAESYTFLLTYEKHTNKIKWRLYSLDDKGEVVIINYKNNNNTYLAQINDLLLADNIPCEDICSLLTSYFFSKSISQAPEPSGSEDHAFWKKPKGLNIQKIKEKLPHKHKK